MTCANIQRCWIRNCRIAGDRLGRFVRRPGGGFLLALITGLPLAISAQDAASPAAIVRLGQRPVYELRSGLGSLDAESRARDVEGRLLKLANDTTAPLDSITASDLGGVTLITGGSQMLATATPEEAAKLGQSTMQLGQARAAAIREAVREYRLARVKPPLVHRITRIAAAWLALVLLMWAWRWLHRMVERRLQHWQHHVQGRTADASQALKLLTIGKLQAVESLVFRLAAGLTLLIGATGALTLTLQQFTATEELSATWLDWFRGPAESLSQSFVDYLPSLGFLVVWTIVVAYAIRMLKFVSRWVSDGVIVFPGFHAEWAEPTYRIAAFLMAAFGLVVAFPYLPGRGSPAFQGVSIFIGVLLSLGSSSAISNIIAGIILTYTRAFRLGDRVKIGDHTGDIIEKSLWVTRVRTIKNEDIVIPNSTVIGAAVINYTEGKYQGGLIIHTTVTIGYDAPWRQVHQIMTEAARRTEGVLADPPPFVFQTALNDYNVSYQINAYTDRPQQMARLYSDLHQHLQDAFNEGGIEILSPMYNQLRDGHHTTIPANYLPPNYRAPGFRVERPGDAG
jgi:small-conductance mechanosensitive channel